MRRETLVVVHTCGNDLIGKLMPIVMGGGALERLEMLQPNPGVREAGVIAQFLEDMYRAGARHFLVSGVPLFHHLPVFNLAWGVVANVVNSGRLEALGISPGDPPELAIQVQAASLNDRWSEVVSNFNKAHPEANAVFFDEVGALDRLRDSMGQEAFDRQMWDMTMFHPSPFGHEQLAVEAHRCVVAGIPAISSTAPPQTTAPATPQAAPAQKSDPIQVKVRNVKGDVSFSVDCDGGWRLAELRKEVLAKAPAGFATPDAVCILALQGKFLEDGQKSIKELGMVNGSLLIAVIKPGPSSK